jgi:hypothetical protein
MALDPKDPTIVYAATGEGNGGLNGCGVLRSGDGGNTWTNGSHRVAFDRGTGGPFLSLIVDPATAGSASSSILLGATLFSNAGIVRSVNSGASWTGVMNTGPASSIVAHPTKPGTFYAGNRVTTPASSRGVYRSNDVGLTWSPLPAPPVDANSVGRVEVAMSKAAPGIVWALIGDRNTGGFLGLFKYDEATSTWTQLAADGVTSAFGGQQTYDLVLAVDPANPQRIYIAGVGAFRSLDGGATFKRMAVDVHVDWHVIVFDPNDPTILWAGTDGGVYLSTDGGDSWSSRSAGLAITQFYPGISVHPQGTRISGGSQDNGTHVFTGTPFWDAFIGGDGGYTAINYANPNIHWGETQWSGRRSESVPTRRRRRRAAKKHRNLAHRSCAVHSAARDGSGESVEALLWHVPLVSDDERRRELDGARWRSLQRHGHDHLDLRVARGHDDHLRRNERRPSARLARRRRDVHGGDGSSESFSSRASWRIPRTRCER